MGTGYTRNDTVNNIADGNIINASDLDGEFDAVQAAFDAATGHTHDGTTGEGAPIEVTGPAQEYVSTGTEFRPKANNTYDLGSSGNQWKDLYVDGTANLDAVDIDGGNIDGTVIGAASAAAGTFTTATATTGNITTVNATTVDTTNIEVTNIKAKDGTAAGSIADATGVVTLASSVLTTTDINGGTIDGTTIGGASAAAGTFTTATATTGNITTVNATTVDSTNVEVTNIKAKDGTASATIADSTGVMTVASSVLTTTDINGGTIDGTTIGGASAAAGTFTNVTANGTINLTGATVSNGGSVTTIDINGGTIDGVTIGGASAGAGTFTTLTATGNVTLGNAETDTVTITADVASNILPSADNTYDLGGVGAEWKDLYIDGTANIDSLVADTADINGGTIDGTVIGGSTPAAISGTTGSFSGDVSIADKIVHTGDTNTAIRFPAADTVTVETAGSERMRIDASGNLLVGKTVTTDYESGCRFLAGVGGSAFISSDNDSLTVWADNGTANTGGPKGHIVFKRGTNGVLVGSITSTTTATSYNTSSDYRLKENVVPLADAADRLAQIPVHRFNFIADPDKTVDGFLAHEVQAFVPEAVTGEKDAVGKDGKPVHQGIDQSKLVPLLTAALQEALQKIEALEARITALEGTSA